MITITTKCVDEKSTRTVYLWRPGFEMRLTAAAAATFMVIISRFVLIISQLCLWPAGPGQADVCAGPGRNGAVSRRWSANYYGGSSVGPLPERASDFGAREEIIYCKQSSSSAL